MEELGAVRVRPSVLKAVTESAIEERCGGNCMRRGESTQHQAQARVWQQQRQLQFAAFVVWPIRSVRNACERAPAGNAAKLYESRLPATGVRNASANTSDNTPRQSPCATMSAPTVAALPDLSMLDFILDAPVCAVKSCQFHAPSFTGRR